MIPGTDACCILLYGDIGEYDDNVRSGDIARELLEAEALTGKVDVRINSNGGEVYSGIAIFNALKNSKADITIYVDGIAASMASVIALCGKPVQMSRYARLMLHSVQGGCYGNKDSASIPYAVSGTGTKTVSLYVDGVAHIAGMDAMARALESAAALLNEIGRAHV